ncbi:uncharacterized protein HKW66_Vig0232210 [Vigna angularis]|uniref:Uncharacterized protein n=1 Tax=Phaseolus angularis TaxID=3914 RepID=A0A8T0KBE5_PHAAN|nr:uncharacterized protein HKW66_Vig0232210 [Vigna angularis]
MMDLVIACTMMVQLCCRSGTVVDTTLMMQIARRSLTLCVDGGEILWRFDLLLGSSVARGEGFTWGVGVVDDLFRSTYLMMVRTISGGVTTRQVDLVRGYLESMCGGVQRRMVFLGFIRYGI